MTYQKFCKNSPGMILVDALLALSLASIFIFVITAVSLGSRDIFFRTRERQQAMRSYFSMASTTTRSFMYGNDRTETDTTVADTLAFSEVHMNSLLDINDAAGTPLCSVDFLHGHDQHAASITVIQLPVSQSLPVTDLEVRNGIGYASADSTVSADPDVYVFDIRDPNNPKVLSSLNTGPGISAIALAGRRIFAAARSTAAELHVIRMDSPTSLVLESKFKLPLPYATATPPLPDSIFYDNGRIYLGTEKWDGPELNIVDVTNPAKPLWLGGSEVGTKVNALYERSGTAYMGDADQNQLRLFDVNDPTNPFLLNAFSSSGWQRQEGQSIDLFENALSLGRTSGGFDIQTDPEMFTWATSSLYSLINPKQLNDPGGVYGVITDRAHLFLGSRQAGKEFKIFDRNLSVTSSTTYSLPAGVQSMTCDNDSMYVLGHTAPVIYKIDFNV